MAKRIEHRWIDGIEHKRCSGAKEEPPHWVSIDNFSPKKICWDGLYHLCRKCASNSSRDSSREYSRKQRSTSSGRVKLRNVQRRRRSTPEGREKSNAVSRKARATPQGREKSRAAARRACAKGYAVNPRKYQDRITARLARKAGFEGDFDAMMNDKYDLQEGQCCYCPDLIVDKRATPPNTPGTYEDEHVIADSKGGRWDETNMVCACQPCNSSKGDMDPQEWFAQDPRRLTIFLRVHGPLDAEWFQAMMKDLRD